MGLGARVALQQAEKLLVKTCEDLRARLEAGDVSARGEYLETIRTLAAIAPSVAPEASGALLTTAELAERLRVSTKTLLKRKALGEIRPAIVRGKFLRWSGMETL